MVKSPWNNFDKNPTKRHFYPLYKIHYLQIRSGAIKLNTNFSKDVRENSRFSTPKVKSGRPL